MKIVKNYKGLKKWAKTLFVALLTICIVFTTTGVGSLLAYAVPVTDLCTDGEPHVCNNWTPGGAGEHEGVCEICGEPVTESCSYRLDSNQNGTHASVCIKCGATPPEYASVPCEYDDNGVCECGYHNPDYVAPSNDPIDCSNGHTHDDNTQYAHPSSTEHRYVCTVCGETVTENCTFQNGECTVCGQPDPNATANAATNAATNMATNATTTLSMQSTQLRRLGAPMLLALPPAGMTILYDGAALNTNRTYVGRVLISAEGYTIATSDSGPFVSPYVYSTVGSNQSFTLRFNKISDDTKSWVTIENITILPVDDTANGSSTGKITVYDYSSDKIAATDETVLLTRELVPIRIEAANAASGVVKIEYATAEEVFYTVSDILGAVVDGKIKWKPYSDAGRPTIPSNKAVYIYARITDGTGAYTYLSTGKVIHDTTPPTVDSVSLNPRSNDQILPITGKDTLSGIDTFYVYYEPKKDDSKVPTAEEIMNKGVATQVEVRDGKSAAASVTYSTNDLLKDVTYSFYVVAKDKAGNISAVKTYETKGEGPASKDVSGNSIDSGSDGSGLAAAPNGIAGSGGGSTPKGSGSSGLAAAPNGIAGSGSGSGSGSALDRQINRKPYISDATGDTKIGLDATGGWDKITDEVKGATEGTSMDVEMAGLSVIPDRVLGALRGRDLSVIFKLPQDVEWQINGKDIETSSGADIDMGVVMGARNIPLDMLDAVTGTFPHTEIELKHDGPLGFTGKLRVPLCASNAGMYAYLYYYDTEAQELVLKQSSQVNSVGMAEFDFDHASDYTIVLRADEMLTGAAETDADAGKSAATFEETAADSASGAYVFSMSDAVGNSASVRIWLFAVAIISALLCGAILFMPGLQRPETAL
ncbi:MAG: hypothetical protein K5673_10985 [Lachnospiraceae bacterium]|nr:hypothetical protein [Lachnospiraceae bacterium]